MGAGGYSVRHRPGAASEQDRPYVDGIGPLGDVDAVRGKGSLVSIGGESKSLQAEKPWVRGAYGTGTSQFDERDRVLFI